MRKMILAAGLVLAALATPAAKAKDLERRWTCRPT